MNQILNVPNAVSFARLAAIPYFWWVTLGAENIALAAALIFVIGSTDWIDGYLARKLNQVTEFGKLLDPIADRLMIASAVIAGLIAGAVPPVIAVPLLVREGLVAVGALVLAVRGGGKLDVRYLGKLSTFLLYGAIPTFYLVAADIALEVLAPAAWIAGVIGLLLYYAVGWNYAQDIRSVLRAGQP